MHDITQEDVKVSIYTRYANKINSPDEYEKKPINSIFKPNIPEAATA
jgi:hypothetical protein